MTHLADFDVGQPEPAESRQKSHHLLRKSAGLVIMTISVMVCLSLITWNVEDPSLTHSTNQQASNLFGFAGAAIADVLIQFLGFAASVLALLPALWGWQLFRLTQSSVNAAQILGFLGITLFSCGVVACLPTPQTWPLPSGLGGLVGNAVIALPQFFLGEELSGLYAFGVAFTFFLPLPFLAKLVFVADKDFVRKKVIETEPKRRLRIGNELEEMAYEEEADPSFLPTTLGAMAHIGFSARTKIRNLISSRRKRQISQSVPQHDLTMTQANPDKTRWGQLRDMTLNLKKKLLDDRAENDSLLDYPLSQTHHDNQTPPAHLLETSGNAFKVTATMGGHIAPVNFDETIASSPESEAHTQRPSQTQNAPDPLVPEAPPVALATDRQSSLSGSDVCAPVTIRVAAGAPPSREAASVPITLSEPPSPAFKSPAEFQLPPLHLLSEAPEDRGETGLTNAVLAENAHMLENVLADFGVKGEIIHVRPGPVVTLYELEPAPGIKSSRVIGLADDIARSMSAIAARVAVIPGKNAIGIELPNAKRETIYLHESIAAKTFATNKGKLPICLGKTIGGEGVIADLAKMPHLLVAGTTGSGKSVAINTMILSLLFRMKPEQCRMIMIDPKMLELSVYDGIPHLLTPVVTDPKKAVVSLKWTVREMEDRYRKMSKVGVRNIDGFNTRVSQAAKMGEAIVRTIQTGYDQETGEAIFEREELALEPLPFIVVIIDEMADLMMVAGKEIEGTIQRLAQMARAAGIHVIMATQRPSVDVITGTIKANFPTRISFQVTSKIDSRTILGEQGAEQLLGMGDMLYMAGGGRIQRVHGPFVDDGEVEDVVRHLKDQGIPQYLGAVVEDVEDDSDGASADAGSKGSDSDDPYDQAVAIVLRDKKVSTSYVQRRLGIGYNRAASIIERMEEEGIISPANHAGKREILVGSDPEENL